jgi:uncharacterized protein YjlB
MPLFENIRKVIETATGYYRPGKAAAALVQKRKANTYKFRDDGNTPNNPRFALVHYRSAVRLDLRYDSAAIFEDLFSLNGWKDSWRNGVYDFLHFHTSTHEVLGIARGDARVQFGGAKGRVLRIKAGDVIILPAGTGHHRLSASKDLLVVGAYPAGGKYDEPKPSEVDHEAAVARIAKVKPPKKDPVFGSHGPLKRLWRT